MKTKLISMIVIILFICTLLFAVLPRSKQINSTINGVLFHIEDETVVPLTIKMNGNLRYTPFGEKRFEGTIQIEGNPISDPNSNRELSMVFTKSGSGLMSFVMDFKDLRDGQFWNSRYGAVFASSDFSKISIQVVSTNKRTLISGPANTKTDALEISKSLMKSYIEDYKLIGYFD